MRMLSAGIDRERPSRRMRLALIALASDILIERDFWRMGLAAGVDIFTTRVPLAMPLTAQNLARLEDGIEQAMSVLLPEAELDAVVFGCTSGSAIIGPDNVARRINEARPGLAVTNPATAAVAALKHLRCRKVAFVAPYTSDVAEITSGVFAAAGVGFSDRVCFGLMTDEDIAAVSVGHYRQTLAAMNLRDADAIFLSCTTAQALDAIQSIEAEIGLPVITSNQAAFWHALYMAGRPIAVSGFGRLLEPLRPADR